MDLYRRHEHGRDEARRRRLDIGTFAAIARRPSGEHRHRAVGRRREPGHARWPAQGRHLPIDRPAALQVRSAQQPARLLPPSR